MDQPGCTRSARWTARGPLAALVCLALACAEDPADAPLPTDGGDVVEADLGGGGGGGAEPDAIGDAGPDGMVDGPADAAGLPDADSPPPPPPACSVSDEYRAEDLGPVIRWQDVPDLALGATIADNTSYLMADGRVRLYFWTNLGRDVANGVRSAVSADGLSFALEEGFRIAGPYGHPKRLEIDGGIRMFHLVISGIGSSWSPDGLQFTHEDGLRLANATTGLARTGGVSVISRPDGGYRAYFSDLGLPGVPPGPTRLKSARSPDALVWTMDEGVRIGDGAPHLTGRSRQPFALHRGGACVTLFYTRIESSPTRIAYATALDGMTFTEQRVLEIPGFSGPHAGANVQPLADGSVMLYYDAMDPDMGNHLRAARVVEHN